MKYLFLFTICLLLFSCKQDVQDVNTEQYENHTVTACDVKDPLKNFTWLKELIKKAETDKTGNYWGTVWLVKYNGQDFFVTNMMLGSGGILYWIFDCSGNHYVGAEIEHCPADYYVGNHHFFLNEEDLPPLHELTLDVVVYSNVPF
ncbi:MAG: hypothetical protein LBT25_04850 [Candidatus Symbiothrix sp.]|jgi:hypothetical protein|nr:hypothetical protein [Candidatus Symbiothrix sp.]